MRRAFSLIETCIAIALGSVIAGAALACLRAASSAIASANRLATENSCMRAGFTAALDEADFWQAVDRADDPTRQRLRGGDGVRWLPFAPFSLSFAPTESQIDGLPNRWTPTDPWPAHDPRYWFRGNLAEHTMSTDNRWGYYENFTHLEAAPDLGPGGSGIASPRHRWLFNQMEGLKNALGYYGLCEYLPANALYAVYGDRDSAVGWSHEWSAPTPQGIENNYLSQRGADCDLPRGDYVLTMYHLFALPVNASGAAALAETRHGLLTGRDSNSAHVAAFETHARWTERTLALRPAHWPDVRMSVARYVAHGRFTTQCAVRWLSPVTGDAVELSFTTLATSLRGARQQRVDPGDPSRDLDGGTYQP
ncbi:MAG TPA: hypothetical protein VEL07_05950 [Planctomycetota bacterium]|nr:hypothetical protein [Planctomycetota bacterium]